MGVYVQGGVNGSMPEFSKRAACGVVKVVDNNRQHLIGRFQIQ